MRLSYKDFELRPVSEDRSRSEMVHPDSNSSGPDQGTTFTLGYILASASETTTASWNSVNTKHICSYLFSDHFWWDLTVFLYHTHFFHIILSLKHSKSIILLFLTHFYIIPRQKSDFCVSWLTLKLLTLPQSQHVLYEDILD